MRALWIAAACGLFVIACDDAEPSGGDDAGPPMSDAGAPGSDAAIDAGPAATDAGPATTDAGPAATDAGPPPAGFPDLEYDTSGCLTADSAGAICTHDGSAACARVVGCGLTDMSQCGIDCTMATVLCLDSARVDACLAAVEGGDCMAVESGCMGWMHF